MNYNNLFLMIQKHRACVLLFIITIINVYFFSFGYLLTADDVFWNSRMINSINIFTNIFDYTMDPERAGNWIYLPINYLAAYLQTSYLFRLLFTCLWFFMLFKFSVWAEVTTNLKVSSICYFSFLIFQVLNYNHMPPNSYPLQLSLPFIIILILRIHALKNNNNALLPYLILTCLMLFEYYFIFNTTLFIIELILHNNKNAKYIKYNICSVFMALILMIFWRLYFEPTYSGIQIAAHFDIVSTAKVAIVYAIGGIVLFYKTDFSLLNFSNYILLFFYLIIVFYAITTIYNRNYHIKTSFKRIFVISLIFILSGIACVLPIALTDKYQHWVLLHGSKAYVISRVSYLFILAGISFSILKFTQNKFFKHLSIFFFLAIASYSFLHNYIMAYDMKDYCSAWERAEALSVFSGSPDPNLNLAYFCDPKQRVSMHPNFDRNKYWIDFIKWKSSHNENTIPLNISSIQKYGLAESYAEGIDFTKQNKYPFLESINGLSGREHWGRWSDANVAATVNFQFFGTLPDLFILSLKAKAFGPNIGETMQIKIADQKYSVQIPKDGSINIKINVNLMGQQTNKIELIPPKPTSPKELGLSADRRKLGIGFISMKIIPIEGDNK